MYDREILLEVLKQTSDAVQKVIKRFEPVTSVDYFTDTPDGMEKLDAICMVIIAIGESLKKIDNLPGKTFISISGNRLERSDGYARYYLPSLF